MAAGALLPLCAVYVVAGASMVTGHVTSRPEDDCGWATQLVTARIRNLENRMDIDMKIMRNEVRKEIRRNGYRGSRYRDSGDEGESMLFEVRTLQMDIKQLSSGLDTFKFEIQQMNQNLTMRINENIQSVANDLVNVTETLKTVAADVRTISRDLKQAVEPVTRPTDSPIIETTVPSTPGPYTTPESYATGNLRLVGGDNWREGRVEMYYEGQWGTICDDGWDRQEAQVVCRHLGMSGGTPLLEGYFGQGTGRILLDDLACYGSESSLLDCSRSAAVGEHNCGHGEDAAVRCDDTISTTPTAPHTTESVLALYDSCYNPTEAYLYSGRVNIGSSGRHCQRWDANYPHKPHDLYLVDDLYTVDGSRSNASNYCRSFRDETDANYPWCYTTDPDQRWERCDIPICTGEPRPPRLARLMGSHLDYEGRLEVFNMNNGEWGTVCRDLFGSLDADVACRMMGFRGGVVIDTDTPAADGPIWLDNLECSGSETSLFNCPHNGVGNHNCAHSEDASVRCNSDDVISTTHVPTPTPTTRDQYILRLVGGAGGHEGRLEVALASAGVWGTVCDDYWERNDANVVCRMLGYGAAAEPLRSFGEGSGSIWLDNVGCTGNESSLFDCPNEGWGSNNCGHGEDVGLVCQFTSDGDLRLVDGVHEREGRVEMYYQGEWGTICDDEWGSEEAQVVCRKLGISGGTPVMEGSFGEGTGRILLDDLSCDGSESSLLDCSRPGGVGENNCGHGEDAGVRCSDPISTTTADPLSTVDMRLVGGRHELEGRLEVFYNGSWGTICDDDWTNRTAQLACSAMNYCEGEVYTNAHFGEGTGPIWLDDVKCKRQHARIFDCSHGPWGQTNCGHDEDVGVSCDLCPPTTTTEATSTTTRGPDSVSVRLADGPTPVEGRVEVMYEGQWGTVCDDDWDNNDALVICRMLNLIGGMAVANSHYGAGSGSILMDDVGCTGSEDTITDCHFNGWNIHNCGSSEHAGVICSQRLQVDDVRLADGAGPKQGRVEIQVNGTWGTVCDDDFGSNAATVFCTMLGYSGGGRSYPEAKFGEGAGPVILDDVLCTGYEMSLSECRYRAPFTTNCEHDEDVGVLCLDEDYVTTPETYNVTFPSDNSTNQATTPWPQNLTGTAESTTPYMITNGTVVLNETVYVEKEEIRVRLLTNDDGNFTESYDHGLVQLEYENTTRLLCFEQWTNASATVICRMLGFSYGEVTLIDYFPDSIATLSVFCDGWEPDVRQCSSFVDRSCLLYGFRAGVHCHQD